MTTPTPSRRSGRRLHAGLRCRDLRRRSRQRHASGAALPSGRHATARGAARRGRPAPSPCGRRRSRRRRSSAPSGLTANCTAAGRAPSAGGQARSAGRRRPARRRYWRRPAAVSWARRAISVRPRGHARAPPRARRGDYARDCARGLLPMAMRCGVSARLTRHDRCPGSSWQTAGQPRPAVRIIQVDYFIDKSAQGWACTLR